MSIANQPASMPPPPRATATRLSPAAAYIAVLERLQAARRRIVRTMSAALWFTVLAVALGVFAGLVVLDWSVELNGFSRLLLLFGLLSSAGWGLISGWRRWIAPYSLERAAIDVEEELHEFGQGLRTALDYQEAADRDFAARPAAALPDLINALHNETYAVSQSARWDEVGPARWLWRSAFSLLLVSGSCFISLAVIPDLWIAAGRMFLLPWQYTVVAYEPQHSKIKHGESVLIKAEISGRPISSARLRYRTKGKAGDWTTVELLPANHNGESATQEGEAPAEPSRLLGTVQTKLTNLQSDIEFEVVAGPLPLPPGSIRVLQPLVVESFSANITPPAYTKKPVATVDTRDFKVWEGSNIALHFKLNRAAATAAIKRLDGKTAETLPAELPAVVAGANLVFDLNDLRQGGTFEITAAADDEMELQPQRIKIQVTLDRKPTVKWIEPQEQWEVTPTTEVTMAIAAEDDLGIYKAGIAWQVGSDELQTLWETDALGAEQSLSAAAALLLEDHALTHRDSVNYYAFAEDNYFNQPRRTTTPLRFIDIRAYQRDFQLDEAGSGGEGGRSGKSVTLEELIKRQRDQLNQSFANREQKPAAEALQKMADSQSELKEQTAEFAQGIEERGGPVESLEVAVQKMESAATSLASHEVEPAVAAQQQALAELVKARENLRKKLNQSNSKSSAETKKFDRQQRQKLRLPEQKKQDAEQQLAQAQKKLEDLAKREREWSQSACQACQNAASQSKSSSQSPSQSPSPAESQQQAEAKQALAKSQEEMLQELAEIQKQLEQNTAAGQTANEQASRAAEAMQQSLAELKKNEGDGAKEQGQQAADRLAQLAAHLAAMNQKDVGQRLGQAQKDAARIATAQEKLAEEADEKPADEKPGGEKPEAGGERKKGSGEHLTEPSANARELAAKQEELAQQAKMLAEVLQKLRQDAKGEKGSTGEKLEQIAAEQKPGEIAQGMERTAADLKSGKPEAAKPGINQARDELLELAKALGAARQELSQPELQELIQLEEQLAQLREQAAKAGKRGEGREAGDGGQKPGKGKKPGEGNEPVESSKPGEGKSSAQQSARSAEKWEKLQERLHELAESDKRLDSALRQLGGQTPPKPGDKLKPSEFQQNGGQEMPAGHYSWAELGNYKGLDEVAKALQTKIQEAILAGALQDADEPVPPEYKGLVEKYYRTLSDDLR